MTRRRTPSRPVADANTLLKGNRAYILKVRKACSDALRSGSGMVACEDEDGDDIVTTIVCSKRMGRRPIGFTPPGSDDADTH